MGITLVLYDMGIIWVLSGYYMGIIWVLYGYYMGIQYSGRIFIADGNSNHLGLDIWKPGKDFLKIDGGAASRVELHDYTGRRRAFLTKTSGKSRDSQMIVNLGIIWYGYYMGIINISVQLIFGRWRTGSSVIGRQGLNRSSCCALIAAATRCLWAKGPPKTIL